MFANAVFHFPLIHLVFRHVISFVKQELQGWQRFDVVWFLSCCIVVLALSLYWHDTVWGIISALTGIAYTMCNGLGKRSAYVFGVVNSFLYALISLKAGYYGEAMLNGLYYFPMMFVGFALWQKHLNRKTYTVEKRTLRLGERVAVAGIILGGTALYGLLLALIGGTLPGIDALTTVTSIVALVLAVKRYAEQWPLWTFVNAVTIVLWGINFAQGSENIATLIMWVVYFANGIIMWVKWSRAIRSANVK